MGGTIKYKIKKKTTLPYFFLSSFYSLLKLCFGNLLEILDRNCNLFCYFKSSKVGLLSWFMNIFYYQEDLNPYQFYMNPHRIRSFSVLENSVIITYPNQPSDGLRPVRSGSCQCYAPDSAMVQSYSIEFLIVPLSPYPKHTAIIRLRPHFHLLLPWKINFPHINIELFGVFFNSFPDNYIFHNIFA